MAQFIGAEESKEAWCSFDVSLICGIIMSVLFLLAAGVFPSQILGLYTKDMSIVNTGTVYFRIVALSYIQWLSAIFYPHGCAVRNMPRYHFWQALEQLL